MEAFLQFEVDAYGKGNLIGIGVREYKILRSASSDAELGSSIYPVQT